LISLDNEDDGKGSPRRVRRRYPKWKELQHVKDKVELVVGLKFSEPSQFKETLKLYAIQKILLISSICTSRRSRYLY